VAAGIASGAIAPGALGAALGVKGSVALVGAEMGLALGVNKSVLNQQLDGKAVDWSQTMKEGAVESAFGAWSGYGAGGAATNALAQGKLAPGGWFSSYDWSKLPGDIANKLRQTLLKLYIKNLLTPKTVWASTWNDMYSGGGGGGGGGGGTGGGEPPSKGK
jgi:hypothetical protein